MKKSYEAAVTAMRYVICKNAEFASTCRCDDARHWAFTAIYGVAEALERLGEVDNAFEFTAKIIDEVCLQESEVKSEKRER